MDPGKEFFVEDHSTNMMKKMQKLRDMKTYCDVILSVSERNFPAHRAILASGSDYFDKMFSANMKEKHAGAVALHDVTIAALDSILGFLYTGKISLCLENVTDILHAANMMQIQDLIELIAYFLLENLDQENCLYFRNLSTTYDLKEVEESVDDFILNNFEVISRQASFCDILREDLAKFLASDNLMVKSENTVYEALVSWIKKEQEERCNKFPGLFTYIRLQLMTPDYLCDVVRKEALVRNFRACTDLVEEGLDFHIRPDKHDAQKPRKGQVFDTNAVVICCNTRLYVYNFRNQSWTGIPVQNRIVPSCAVTSRYRTITFCGGYPANNQAVACATVSSFNGSHWEELSPLKAPRAGAAAVYVQGELHIFGGEKRRNNYRTEDDFVDDIEVFDAEKNTWISSATIPTHRSFAAAVATDDLVYLLGGYVASNQYPHLACNTVDVYDTKSKTWTTGTPMPQQRACFGATLWRNNLFTVGLHGHISLPNTPSTKSLAFAGGYQTNNALQNSSAFMDINSGTWTTVVAAMPVQMGNTWACCAGNNIMAIGNNNNGLLILNPNALTYDTDNQTLPGVTGGSLGVVVWKQGRL